MSRALITLTGGTDRSKAVAWIGKAPTGTRVMFMAPRRSVDQNSKLWAILGEVSEQVEWHGIKLKPDDWKFIFIDALKRELRMVPNLDGNGFVNIGRSSSSLSKSEMSDMIELIMSFGANHGVIFRDHDSNSSTADDSTAETDQPASGEVPPPPDAGVNSNLPDDWRKTYADIIKKPAANSKALLTLHNEALVVIGGKPTDDDLAEMRAIYGLRQRNMLGELSAEDYAESVRELL